MVSGALAGRVSRRMQARAMKKHGELSVPGAVVIVVDDDSAVRNSLKFSLEIEGFVVRTYASGADLLGGDDLPFCRCIVVDQKMAGMTGLDLIAKLRNRHILAPAILITSQPNTYVAERAARANIPIVEKPLLGNALMDRIRDACAAGDNAQP
jgi:two-component system, LuxR family, response regulator FixJ